jgi:hypothetical protein
VEGKFEVKRLNVCRGGDVDTYPGTLDVDDKYPTVYVRTSPTFAHVIRRARFFDVLDADAEYNVYKTSM